MNIERLGITPEKDGWNVTTCKMLEVLIDICTFTDSEYIGDALYDQVSTAIELATGKTWEEVKELIR
jgi:hypothetical protein